jgi:starch synthase
VVADEYYDRPGLYGGPEGDYTDNAERFAFFCRAAVAFATRLRPPPDVVHCHDWHTALVPLLARAASDPWLTQVPTVLTIHNLGYQGVFPAGVWPVLGLDARYFTQEHLEFYGSVNFLKGGLVSARALTTVSRRYAEEILTPEHGHGLDGVLRKRRNALVGIVNGVDYARWDPRHDPHLAAPYGPDDLSGKARCKHALQTTVGLPARTETPLIGMISRLAEQKGLDLVTAALPALLGRDLQLVILGRGDRRYEDALGDAARAHPTKLAVRFAFDDALAHQIEGGADAFLMPSHYEPCGLNQMYSLRYGTVPIVRATGGLDDTIVDIDANPGDGTGFKFADYTTESLLGAVERALTVYQHTHVWERTMRRGMAADFSWQRSAAEYLRVYQRLLAA